VIAYRLTRTVSMSVCLYIYIYMYECVYVCVCLCKMFMNIRACMVTLNVWYICTGELRKQDSNSMSATPIILIGLCILLRVYQSISIETSVRNKCWCTV
jgi:hypothetical protein